MCSITAAALVVCVGGVVCGGYWFVNPYVSFSIPILLVTNQKLFSLSDSEQSGFVGKLKVHKSGKVK